MNGEWTQLSFRVVVKKECQGTGEYDSELDIINMLSIWPL